jgi:hypothetical protein
MELAERVSINILDELLALLGSCYIYISGHIKPAIRHSSSESERLYRLWVRDKGPSFDIWKRGAAQGGVSLGSAGKKSYGTWARSSFNLFFPLESQIRNRQAV